MLRMPFGSTKVTCCRSPASSHRMKSGWKLPASKKPTPRPPAPVAQQVELPAHEGGGVAVAVRLQVLDEAALAPVERRGRDLHQPAFEGKQGLVQMPIEPDGAEALEGPRLQIAGLDRRLQRLQLRHDVLPRLLDEDAIAVLATFLPHRGEIRIVLGQRPVFEVRKLPLVLAEGVVTLHVLLEQRERDLLPEPDLAGGVGGEPGFRDEQAVPGGIGQEVANAGARQVQVVPAPLRLEALQREEQMVEVQKGDVLRLQVGLLLPGRRAGILGLLAGGGPGRVHGLDLRIPIEDHLIPLEPVRSRIVRRQIGRRPQGRDGSELAEGARRIRCRRR